MSPLLSQAVLALGLGWAAYVTVRAWRRTSRLDAFLEQERMTWAPDKDES